MKQSLNNTVEIWGGLECTINRVGDSYFDQIAYCGHETREGDIAAFSSIGIKKMRYPVLWEKHRPIENEPINWSLTQQRLQELQSNNIDVIAGLVHHGSGPAYVNILDNSFANGLADYAAAVAAQFPWIEYYTPINEPLTTARFCGLYGLWFPHKNNNQGFCRVLVNECKATVLAMQAIRKINPNAKLVQTDDLGKIHSTRKLKYQADFENERRWLGYDLLCGKVKPGHTMFKYLLESGISEADIQFFADNSCPPDILGFNHYLTSERYLDENINAYPKHTHGGNAKCIYADVEAVRVGKIRPSGPYNLLKEAWERYKRPLAVTEVHLYCTREEQMRWLKLLWESANKLRSEGVDIRAITPWAMLGSFGWNNLLTQPHGEYEPGVFDVSGGTLRPTIMAKMIAHYSRNLNFNHPVLNTKGWWQRKCRVIYGEEAFYKNNTVLNHQPLLIIGECALTGPVISACELRGLRYELLPQHELEDLCLVNQKLNDVNPWAVIFNPGGRAIDNVKMPGKLNMLRSYKNITRLCDGLRVPLLTLSALAAHPDINSLYVHIEDTVSETAVMQIINNSIDLLLDEETGIFDAGLNGNLLKDQGPVADIIEDRFIERALQQDHLKTA